MSRKSRFRRPFNKQHGKRSRPSIGHDFYQIYWSLWRQKLPSILGLFVNTLTADEKYFLVTRENLTQHNQTQLSEKRKLFLNFFSVILKPILRFECFQKKITRTVYVFAELWPPKNAVRWMSRKWLGKCLKSPISEDPSTSNMISRLKHCWNLHDSTFIKFIDHCEGNWVERNPS